MLNLQRVAENICKDRKNIHKHTGELKSQNTVVADACDITMKISVFGVLPCLKKKEPLKQLIKYTFQLEIHLVMQLERKPKNKWSAFKDLRH